MRRALVVAPSLGSGVRFTRSPSALGPLRALHTCRPGSGGSSRAIFLEGASSGAQGHGQRRRARLGFSSIQLLSGVNQDKGFQT